MDVGVLEGLQATAGKPAEMWEGPFQPWDWKVLCPVTAPGSSVSWNRLEGNSCQG